MPERGGTKTQCVLSVLATFMIPDMASQTAFNESGSVGRILIITLCVGMATSGDYPMCPGSEFDTGSGGFRGFQCSILPSSILLS